MGLWSRRPRPPRSLMPPYQSGNETATRIATATMRIRRSVAAAVTGGVSAVEVFWPGVAAELLEQSWRQGAAVPGGDVGIDVGDPPHAGDDGGDGVVAQAEA